MVLSWLCALLVTVNAFAKMQIDAQSTVIALIFCMGKVISLVLIWLCAIFVMFNPINIIDAYGLF
jgi:hypothetical protein